MKKYMGYLPLLLLCLIVLFSQLVYGRRNDFCVELSTLSEQENKSVGDPEAIADLKYSFYIGDSNSYNTSVDSGNAWRVDAVGDSFKLTYEPQVFDRNQFQHENRADTVVDVNIEPQLYEKMMPISEENMNCTTFYNNGTPICVFETALNQLTYTITFEQYKVDSDYLKEVTSVHTVHAKVVSKNGNANIPVTYQKNEYNGKEEITAEVTSQNGNADDRYGNLKNYGPSEAQSVRIQDDSFLCIGALQFSVNFDDVKFEKDPTGIYRINKAGKVTQIVSTDVEKETILYMKAFKEKLIAIVEKGGYLYSRLYSTDGKLLDEFKFKEGLDQTNSMMLYPEHDTILFIQESIYDSTDQETLIYDIQNNKFVQIDRMILADSKAMKMNGYPIDSIFHYDTGKGVLYLIVNENSNLIISAQNNKKILYSSRLFGDYGDDEKLALPQAGELIGSNAYENAVSHLLNTQKRTIYDIHLQQDGDDT